MSTTVQIRSGDSASLASPALVPMLLGCASAATTNQIYTFDPGADVTGSIGGGIGADAVLAMLRITKRRVRFTQAAPTWSAAPSVVHVGSGPAVTLALAQGASGCFDDQTIVITVKVGGNGGEGASMGVAYDGTTEIETLPIPAEVPAVLTGTVDLNTFTYPYTGLNTKHLDFTDPSSAVITFGTGYATPQAIADAFNTLAGTVPTAGSETSSAGSFPVALAAGDTFVGKVDQQVSADTLTIAATPATKTGSGATYAAVTAGHTLVLDFGAGDITIIFAGTENSQALYHATINAQIVSGGGGGYVTNAAGESKFITDIMGSDAAGSIVSASADVLTNLGLTTGAFTNAGPNNVANVGQVTAAELAGLLTSTFTGGTAGSTGTAIGTDRVKWATNTAGPSPKGVHFTSGSGVAKVAGFDTSEHNGTSGGNLAVRARIAQGTGGQAYFQLYSTNAGATVTVTIDAAASDADTVLGFSSVAGNLTADGAPATFSPPWTGLTFTFPASSPYIVGDTYTAVCTGPRASIGALTDAASAAKDEYINSPFGFFAVAQPADTASNCAALVSALTTLTEGWAADATAPIFIDAVVGAPFFVASTVLATNNANIQTADAALLLAFQAASANFNSVATCDVYYPGATSLRAGFYRRTAALAWAAQHATAAKLAADVAEGLIPEATLLNPNLLTRARNDATATTKLGGGQGPGFSALKSTQAGLGAVKFVPGATRAGPTSRLRYVGPLTVALEIARLVYPFVEVWEGQTPPANPATRQLSDAEKQQRQSDVYTLLQPTLLPVGQPPNVTPLPQNKACLVQVLNPATGVFLDNGQVIVRISFIPLGEIESVFVDIVATGAIVTEA